MGQAGTLLPPSILLFLGPHSGQTWGRSGTQGGAWGHSRSLWGHFRVPRGHLGAHKVRRKIPMLPHTLPCSGQTPGLGATLWHLGDIQGPLRAILGPTRAGFGAHLRRKLLVGKGEDVADGGGLVVEAEAGEEQQQCRGCCGGSPLRGAVGKAPGGAAEPAHEGHHQPFAHRLDAELPLWPKAAGYTSQNTKPPPLPA